MSSPVLTVDMVEKYLRQGWPQCCGYTMGYFGPIVSENRIRPSVSVTIDDPSWTMVNPPEENE